jgi:hypothetical protein
LFLQNIDPEPTEEQRASVFALLFFTYIDPLMFWAARTVKRGQKLQVEDLPKLGDYEHTEKIKQRGFKVYCYFIITRSRSES